MSRKWFVLFMKLKTITFVIHFTLRTLKNPVIYEAIYPVHINRCLPIACIFGHKTPPG